LAIVYNHVDLLTEVPSLSTTWSLADHVPLGQVAAWQIDPDLFTISLSVGEVQRKRAVLSAASTCSCK
jgi:hypothetical protein